MRFGLPKAGRGAAAVVGGGLCPRDVHPRRRQAPLFFTHRRQTAGECRDNRRGVQRWYRFPDGPSSAWPPAPPCSPAAKACGTRPRASTSPAPTAAHTSWDRSSATVPEPVPTAARWSCSCTLRLGTGRERRQPLRGTLGRPGRLRGPRRRSLPARRRHARGCRLHLGPPQRQHRVRRRLLQPRRPHPVRQPAGPRPDRRRHRPLADGAGHLPVRRDRSGRWTTPAGRPVRDPPAVLRTCPPRTADRPTRQVRRSTAARGASRRIARGPHGRRGPGRPLRLAFRAGRNGRACDGGRCDGRTAACGLPAGKRQTAADRFPGYPPAGRRRSAPPARERPSRVWMLLTDLGRNRCDDSSARRSACA